MKRLFRISCVPDSNTQVWQYFFPYKYHAHVAWGTWKQKQTKRGNYSLKIEETAAKAFLVQNN